MFGYGGGDRPVGLPQPLQDLPGVLMLACARPSRGRLFYRRNGSGGDCRPSAARRAVMSRHGTLIGTFARWFCYDSQLAAGGRRAVMAAPRSSSPASIRHPRCRSRGKTGEPRPHRDALEGVALGRRSAAVRGRSRMGMMSTKISAYRPSIRPSHRTMFRSRLPPNADCCSGPHG